MSSVSAESGGSGTRAVGHTRDAGWEIGVSATVDADPAAVWGLLTGPGLHLWLGDVDGGLPTAPGTTGRTADGGWFDVRSFRPMDRVRLRWSPSGDPVQASTVQVTVRGSGAGRTRVGLHQEQLPNAASRDRQRVHWRAVMAEIAALTDDLVVN